MPINDYICDCGYVCEIMEFGEETRENKICPRCNSKMKKQFPCTCNFKLVYNNQKDICTWGKEGYQSSQYWEQHKKK
jgi:predicted nucleic acid-binding Zn ribbon protein